MEGPEDGRPRLSSPATVTGLTIPREKWGGGLASVVVVAPRGAALVVVEGARVVEPPAPAPAVVPPAAGSLVPAPSPAGGPCSLSASVSAHMKRYFPGTSLRVEVAVAPAARSPIPPSAPA